MEKYTDMYISTPRSYIEVMDEKLAVVARFLDGVVKITNFADLEKSVTVRERRDQNS